MGIATWLDEKAEQGIDVSVISVPDEVALNDQPDETIFFQEIRNQCGVLCTRNHPFATVERYGHWYHSRGRDKDKGPHTGKPPWWLFTKDKELAILTAQQHLEES